MRKELLLAALLLGCDFRADYSDPSAWKPGQVLTEKSSDIGNGYRQVSRSQVNPADHWESVGHFVFVYFKDRRMCQCSADEVSFAPDGRFAVFVDETNGQLMLFNAATSVMNSLSDKYIGDLYAGEWDLA